jgi:hypothetical protein
VRLIIQDGGPNDTDARADSVIRDPSVLASKPDVIEVTTVGRGKRGGSIDLLTILLLISFGAFSARRHYFIKSTSGKIHG